VATLVNVCGAARSGTTMLDLMLGNAPDAFSCGEVYTWFRPWQKYHFQLQCRCGQDPCSIWEQIRHVPENQFHATIVENLGINFVADSSKELCWLIDTQEWAVANQLDVFKLLLWKNPIDLVYSHWKRSGDLTAWRHEFVSYYGKFLQTGLPFRSVHFNELVKHPQRKLEEICAFVGMSYFDGKERFWEKQHHHIGGSHGTFMQMANKDSTIRASETFAPEFEAHIDTLSQQIAEDSEVQQILDTLRQAEVSAGDSSKAVNHGLVARRPYPLWYYARKVRQVFRRYFPQSTRWIT